MKKSTKQPKIIKAVDSETKGLFTKDELDYIEQWDGRLIYKGNIESDIEYYEDEGFEENMKVAKSILAKFIQFEFDLIIKQSRLTIIRSVYLSINLKTKQNGR